MDSSVASIAALVGVAAEKIDGALVGAESLDKLARYGEMLLRWSKKMDLIAPTTPEAMVDRHLADSLNLAAFLLGEVEQINAIPLIYDVGSGAGLPGVVLAVVRPEWSVFLVEPREKRCSFLREVKRQLQLSNVTVVCSDIGKLPTSSAEFTVMTSRAVGGYEYLIPEMRRVIGERVGEISLMVGEDFETPSTLALGPCSYFDYILPRSGLTKRIATIKCFT